MTRKSSSSAMEKYLKEIYSLLNMGCNKKALQEIDKLPKKLKELTVFKALKSLALIRMGKKKQAFEVLNEINPDDDLDEGTLQTMTSCYKESVDVARIVELYEAAAKRKPNDPDIMIHLFMSHVRVFNFKRQKEIAMQMYRNFPKKKRLYSFWTIVSLVMQSQEKAKSCSDTVSDKKVCLDLAEKMCEKMIDEERSHEEIELYLMILRKQNKHEEEYRFLTGPVCLRITDHLSWFNRRRAYLCLDLKMYSRAFKHYFPNLIEEYPDQVEYYQGLFKSAFLLDTEAPSQQQPIAISDQQSQITSQSTGTPVKSSSALAECFDTVEKQCSSTLESVEPPKDQQKGKGQTMSKNLSRTSSSNMNRRTLLRGPFMAKLELFHSILSNESILPKNVYNICKSLFTNKYPTLNALLLEYFQLFGRKIICYYDMDHMLNRFKLTQVEKESLIEMIDDWVSKSIKNRPDLNELHTFHAILNYHILKHSVHMYKTTDDREDRLKIAKQYVDLYDKNRHLGKNSSKTEFQPIDNYCLLAINSIMTNAVDRENLTSQKILTDSIILSLIVMAENATHNSPSNHQLKLTLLKLYSFIGASRQSSSVLLSLDIKHFQIDTVGHLLNPVLYNTGNYSLSRESLETCLEFYAHGVRECLEGLTTSYRDGKYSKIEEISCVLKKLSDSLNATQCVLLKGIVANISATSIDDLLIANQSFDHFKDLHRIFLCEDSAEIIKDNRDFKILKSLNSEVDSLIEKRQLETLADEQLWLKLRYFLIRTVYLQLEYLNRQCGGDSGESTILSEILHGKSVFDDLKLRFEEAIKKTTDKRYSYLEPESAPFRCHLFHCYVSMIEPLIFTPDPSALDVAALESYSKNLDLIVSNLEAKLSSITSLVETKHALLSLTISIEFISLAITSLVSLGCVASNKSHRRTSGTLNKISSGQQQKATASKPRSIAFQMLNKTEAHLTRISNSLRNIDLKSTILDKITSLEKSLVSIHDQERIETKFGSNLIPILKQEATQNTLLKVKEKILESYSESFKEIEAVCRCKVELCRLKNC